MKTKKEEIIEGEVVENNNSDLPVVSQDRIDTATILANIDAQAEIFNKLQEYVKKNLVAKVDYYSIRKGAKPSLGKSGAEKIDFIFNLVPRYVILSKISTDKEIAYELRCDLYNKNSAKFMGSGVGYCSSREDKMQKSMQKQMIKNVESVGNNIIKICKKRSYVDATLSSTMASFIFTQDLEDGYLGSDSGVESKGKNKTEDSGDKTFDWSKLDLNKKPFWGYGDKRKTPPIVRRLYAIAQRLISPKEEIEVTFHSITNKEHSYEYTYGDIKKIDEYLQKIEDGISAEKEEKIDDDFEEQSKLKV